MSLLIFLFGIAVGYLLHLVPDIDRYLRKRLEDDY